MKKHRNGSAIIWIMVIIAIILVVVDGYLYLESSHVQQQSYTDKIFPFSLPYPNDFAFSNSLTEAQKKSVASYMGSCPLGGTYQPANEIGFCYVGGQSSDGFTAAALNVTASTTESDLSCQRSIQNDQGQSTQQVSLNGIGFYHDELGDAGLGHYLSMSSYRTYHDGVCYTIVLDVESDRGVQEKGLSPAFRSMMQAKLESMLETFRFIE